MRSDLARKQVIIDAITGWIACAVVLVIGAALLAGAWNAHRDAVRQGSRGASSEREIERLKGENDALRSEIRALEEDPIYVESVLRDRKMLEPGEKPMVK